MTSPVRSVAVRLSMDPTSYISGATRAERSTLSLDRAVQGVGPHAGTSMEKAAAGAGKAEGALGKLNKASGALGFTLGGLAGVGGAVAVGMSVKWAGDYQSALTRLNTTAGESQKNLGMIGKGMLDMAGQVGIGADELAKGMYTVDSAGIHGADSLLVLKAAAQGAKQEQADLSHVVDAVTTSLHDFHLPASQAATVTSQLIAAVSHGKVTFDELTGAMHSVEPIAASAGMSIAQTAGALAAMTASGMHADQAAQNLASSIRSFEKPTGTMRDELYQLGLDAQDLSAHLGERGIAGTLQIVSQAIVSKMGPAGQVALDALNKNKAAAQDLVIMMHTMPPALAKASAGLLDGTVSIKDYRTAAKDMGGTQAAMALQFLSLYSSSKGFSNILKTGGPAVQTYIGALGKAVGTSEGLSVALQLTGENAGATNKTIAAVGKAAATSSGDIQGWDEVQKNFNQRLAEAEQGAKSFAIEAGQHLLPILTDVLGYVHDHGPAAMHALGDAFHVAETAATPLIAAAGGVLHVFQELPAPMKDVVVTLAALRGASAMGWLNGLSTGAGKVRGQFTAMSTEIGAAFTAAKANQVRMVTESGALWGQAAGQAEKFAGTNTTLWSSTAKAVEQVGVSSGRSVGNLAGLGAAAKTAAGQGLGMMKSAGSGLVSLFGGPWGLALAGAALGVAGLTSVIQAHDQQIQHDTDSVTRWQKAIHFGGVDADSAARHLASMRDELAKNQAAIDTYNAAAASGGARGGIGTLIERNKELKGELDKGTKAWQDQQSAMTPVQIGQERLAAATYNLAKAEQSGNPDKISAAYGEFARAQTYLATETGKENDAQQTQNQRLEKAATDALSARDAALGLHLAQLQMNDAIAQYNKDAHDGQHSTQQLAEEQAQLAQQAVQVARTAGDAAAAQAKANGATETGTTSNAAMLKSLQETAKHLTGPALDAVNGYIRDLQKSTTAAAITREAMANLGVTVEDLPDSHTIVISAPTADALKKLHDLGYVTVTLPNGKVVVTADTHPALSEIQALLQYARTQSIVLRAGMSDLNGPASGNGRMGTYWTGGYTGPGGRYTPAGFVHAGEVVWSQDDVAAHGGPQQVDAMRQSRMPGYASGGIVIPTSISAASIAAIEGRLHSASGAYTAALASFSGGAGVERWRGTVDAVLRALGQSMSLDNGVLSLISHESGGNPAAINLTDSNARAGHPSQGLMQTIPGTFYAYAGPYAGRGITDPFANIYAGVNYALHRYGAGMLLQGGNHVGGKYVGYEKGTDNVPYTGLFGLHQAEAVLTRSDNQALRSIAMRSREVTGGGGTTTVVHHTDARSYPVAVQTADSPERILKSLRDAQYQQEFLHG